MDLAAKFAEVYAGASMLKEALDPAAIREQFESSVSKEEVARRHAQRMEELVKSRAEDNEDSTVLGTMAKRLAPIPQTVGEAMWRLPAIAAGAAGGHALGEHVEAHDPLGLRRFAPVDADEALQAVTSGKDKLTQLMKDILYRQEPAMEPTQYEPAVTAFDAASKARQKEISDAQESIRRYTEAQATHQDRINAANVQKVHAGRQHQHQVGTEAQRRLERAINIKRLIPRLTEVDQNTGLFSPTVRSLYAHGTSGISQADVSNILHDLGNLTPEEIHTVLSGQDVPARRGNIATRANQHFAGGIDRLRQELEAASGHPVEGVPVPVPTSQIVGHSPAAPGAVPSPLQEPPEIAAHRTATARSAKLEKLIRDLGGHSNKDIASILSSHEIGASPESINFRKALTQELGAEGIPHLRSRVENIIREGKNPGLIASLLKIRPYRALGTAAGAAGASALTGLPLALNALRLRGSGGEAANRARKEMQQAIREAKGESARREGLLGQLPKTAMAIPPNLLQTLDRPTADATLLDLLKFLRGGQQVKALHSPVRTPEMPVGHMTPSYPVTNSYVTLEQLKALRRKK